MKYLILFLSFLLQINCYAACYEYELLGEAVVEDDKLKFVVAKDTQSQVKLVIPIKDQDILAPYIKSWTQSVMILNIPEVTFRTKVLKVVSAKYETPDPLNLSSKTSMVKRKEVTCPKD